MIGDRKKGIFSVLLLLALFGAVFYASWLYLKPNVETPKPGGFGAIAMSVDSGIYGAAWGFHDPQSAIQRSLAECTRSGGANCVVKANLSGNCGAMITSGQPRQSYVVTDNDKFQAAAFGLAQCQASGAGDCTVREQFCGSGG